MIRKLLLLAAVISFAALAGRAPASAGQWDWLGNKDYVNCLKLMNSWAEHGVLGGSKYTQNQVAQNREKGRRLCNQKYYGHE